MTEPATDAPATPISPNEFRFFATRAMVGAGAPQGIAQEMTSAALWLAAMGGDAGGCVARAVTALAEGRASGTGLALQAGHLQGDGVLSALFAGPVAADALIVQDLPQAEPGAMLTLAPTDQPLLVLAAIGARLTGPEVIGLRWSATQALLTEGRLCGAADLPAPADTPAAVSVSLLPRRPMLLRGQPPRAEAARLLAGRGITLGASDWQLMMAQFRKCLVPADAHARLHGAGAGLTDND